MSDWAQNPPAPPPPPLLPPTAIPPPPPPPKSSKKQDAQSKRAALKAALGKDKSPQAAATGGKKPVAKAAFSESSWLPGFSEAAAGSTAKTVSDGPNASDIVQMLPFKSIRGEGQPVVPPVGSRAVGSSAKGAPLSMPTPFVSPLPSSVSDDLRALERTIRQGGRGGATTAGSFSLSNSSSILVNVSTVPQDLPVGAPPAGAHVAVTRTGVADAVRPTSIAPIQLQSFASRRSPQLLSQATSMQQHQQLNSEPMLPSSAPHIAGYKDHMRTVASVVRKPVWWENTSMTASMTVTAATHQSITGRDLQAYHQGHRQQVSPGTVPHQESPPPPSAPPPPPPQYHSFFSLFEPPPGTGLTGPPSSSHQQSPMTLFQGDRAAGGGHLRLQPPFILSPLLGPELTGGQNYGQGPSGLTRGSTPGIPSCSTQILSSDVLWTGQQQPTRRH